MYVSDYIKQVGIVTLKAGLVSIHLPVACPGTVRVMTCTVEAALVSPVLVSVRTTVPTSSLTVISLILTAGTRGKEGGEGAW